MKKRIALFLLLASILTKSYSQNVDIFWGQEAKVPSHTFSPEVVGKSGDNYFVIRSAMQQNKDVIERYDGKNALVFSKPLPHPGDKHTSVVPVKVVVVNDEIIVLTCYFDRKENKTILCGGKLDLDGNLKTDFKPLADVYSKNTFNKGHFSVALSGDKAKILLVGEDSREKDANQSFHFTVLGTDFEKIWAKKLDLAYQDEDYTVKSFQIGKDGVVHMLAKVKLPEKSKGKHVYKYLIDSYSNEMKKVSEYELALDNLYISDADFAMDSFDNFSCAGFYSKTNSAQLAGSFFMSVDNKKMKVANTGIKDLDKEFLAQFMSERQASKGKELEHFEINRIIQKKDGGLFVVAQKRYSTSNTYLDASQKPPQWKTHIHHEFDDIIVININQDGSIKWLSKVPKRQQVDYETFGMGFGFISYTPAENDITYDQLTKYLSYNIMVYGDNLYFIYNDNKDNLNTYDSKKLKRWANIKKAGAVVAVMDKDGKVSKSELFSNKDAGTYIEPSRCIQTETGELVFYAEKGKKYKFGTITFK